MRESRHLREGFDRLKCPLLFVTGLDIESEDLRLKRREDLSGDSKHALLVRSWLAPFLNYKSFHLCNKTCFEFSSLRVDTHGVVLIVQSTFHSLSNLLSVIYAMCYSKPHKKSLEDSL